MAKFTNDYSYLAVDEIIDAVIKIKDEENTGYGLDKHSEKAEQEILEEFNIPNGAAYFLSGGTQTNLAVISFLLKPYEGVLSCDTGHINVHETAAIEATGHKIYTLKNKNGKITAQSIQEALNINNNMHMVKLRMVYISNSTEIGTIYTKKELKSLRKICDDNNLLLFIDGARLSCALTSAKCDYDAKYLANIADVFYIGGTKNGMMLGEAVVFKNREMSNEFRYHMKNRGAMLSKTFLVGVQFERMFEDDLFYRLGKHANQMAKYIHDSIKDHIRIPYTLETNQLFIEVDSFKSSKLIEQFELELWEELKESHILRIVTSFKTTKEDCDEIINYILSL